MRNERTRHDVGFSMVEIVVALALLGVLTAAVLPLTVASLRGNDLAHAVTEAKTTAQAEIELMRNRPFHISRQRNLAVADLLDVYFPNTTVDAPSPLTCEMDGHAVRPQSSWSGFVSAESGVCPWEPDPPFYRVVRSVDLDGPGGRAASTVSVASSFLESDLGSEDASGPTVADLPDDYDTTQVGKDTPPSALLGVQVAVVPPGRPAARPLVTATQIAREDVRTEQTLATAESTALQVGTQHGGVPLTLTVGGLELAGSLANTSSARGSAASVLARKGTGEQQSGARVSLVAPPDDLDGSQLGGAEGHLGATCDACWGDTSARIPSIAAGAGLPSVGSTAAPASATLETVENGGFILRGGPGTYRTGFSAADPLATISTGAPAPDDPGTTYGVSADCRPVTDSTTPLVRAHGWVRTTERYPDSEVTESCVAAQTGTISILPGSDAPDGRLRARLDYAVASCRLSGSAHVPATWYGYRVSVERHLGDGVYQTIATVTDAWDGVSSTDGPSGTLPAADPGGADGIVSSWSAASRDDVEIERGGGVAAVRLPAALTIVTKPVREGDEASVLTVTLGAVSCRAEDQR